MTTAFEKYKGAAVLRLLEEGHTMHSDMGGGIDIRLSGFTGHLQFLHTGNVPLNAGLDDWTDVVMDVNGLYKHDWIIVDE